MDKCQLVGSQRAPKFILCNHCNQRGHKARDCPDLKSVTMKQKPTVVEFQGWSLHLYVQASSVHNKKQTL